MRKNQNKPYFVGNVLHYWHDGKLKTFDCSNENVNNQAEKSDKRNGIGRTKDGTFYQEKLPDEVVKALLETGEYLWTKGDRFNDYFADVYHKCWIPLGTTERMGNVASNPCYGMVRRENDKMELCPRCAAIYGIWNNKKCKPLKYKLWDILCSINLRTYYALYSVYVEFREFFYVHSKKGKECIKAWQREITKNPDKGFYLTHWRHSWLKPLMKGQTFILHYNTEKPKSGWYLSVNYISLDVLEKEHDVIW